jgi:hypothetical protein
MKKLFILAAITMLPWFSYAQIVMVEGRGFSEDSLGWHGAITLEIYNTKNIERVYTLGGGSAIQYRKDNHRLLSLNNLRVIRNADDETPTKENKGYQHLRYNYYITPFWTFEAFGQAQFNEVLRIGFRGLLGGGVRMNLIKKEKDQLRLGISGMYEHEEEKDTIAVHDDFRLTSYLSFNKEFNKVISGSLICYYQPLVDDFSDYRVSSGLGFNIKITERFGLNIDASLVYDAQPVVDPDIPKLTYSISNGISYRF